MANMDVFDRLLATLRTRLPGVTQQALSLEIFNTIDEFFRLSSAWRWETALQLNRGETIYPIFPPSPTEMVQVLGVVHKGTIVPPVDTTSGGATIRQRGRIVGMADDLTGDTLFEPAVTATEGGVFQYSVFFPTYIEIDVPPSEDAAQFPLNLLLALTLNYQCLEDEPNEWPLDPWMFSAFHEVWLDGTVGRMMSQPSKPWTNAQAAQYHLKRFRNQVARAKQTAARGYVYNKPNWRFPAWA